MTKRLVLLTVLNGAIRFGAITGGALVLAAPALADVKAGAEAWARGDYPAAVREWGGPASDGDADAQYNLGQAYKLGRGVPQDLRKAEKWFGKAAAQGHLQGGDNYGLLLFDRGEHALALPYIKAAAERGDPRAQYLLGIAHFNGDLMAKDWVRAYALMSLARGAGLPQAGPAMTQMDGFIPLAQRQQAAGLALQLASDAEANRSRQLATAELGGNAINPGTTPGAPPLVAAAAPVVAAPAVPVAAPPPSHRAPPSPEEAVAMAERVSAGSTPRTAGADYARPPIAAAPAGVPVIAAPPKPVPTITAVKPQPAPLAAAKPLVQRIPKPAPVVSAPVATASAPTPRPVAPDATWRIQFGAFGVAGNADALWNKLRVRPEVSGHPRINVAVGSVVKLQAGQFTHDSAQSACSRLSAAGITCIAVRN
ncbi:MAG: SPOR domain-containing protein [Novosphingobium sp.]